MNATLILAVALTVPTGPPDRVSTVQATRTAHVPNCFVALIEDVQVPAQESGLLVEIRSLRCNRKVKKTQPGSFRV